MASKACAIEHALANAAWELIPVWACLADGKTLARTGTWYAALRPEGSRQVRVDPPPCAVKAGGRLVPACTVIHMV